MAEGAAGAEQARRSRHRCRMGQRAQQRTGPPWCCAEGLSEARCHSRRMRQRSLQAACSAAPWAFARLCCPTACFKCRQRAHLNNCLHTRRSHSRAPAHASTPHVYRPAGRPPVRRARPLPLRHLPLLQAEARAVCQLAQALGADALLLLHILCPSRRQGARVDLGGRYCQRLVLQAVKKGAGNRQGLGGVNEQEQGLKSRSSYRQLRP